MKKKVLPSSSLVEFEVGVEVEFGLGVGVGVGLTFSVGWGRGVVEESADKAKLKSICS